MDLTREEAVLLHALAAGWTLKSHRDIEGHKAYRLHGRQGEEARTVARTTVAGLRARDLIDSNKKFPAATYLLTDRGRAALAALGRSDDDLPLTATGWK
jgi:hypothetical protein